MRHEQLARSLQQLLDREAKALTGIRKAMVENRTVFVSLGANKLNVGVQSLDKHWQHIAEMEEQREAIAKEMQTLAGSKQPLSLARILLDLPMDLHDQLQASAKLAKKEAQLVRVENIVGTRLLKLSEQANESILHGIIDLNRKGTGYDCHARSTAATQTQGNLISGTV